MNGNRVEEYASVGFQELWAYYINRLSYKEVENLVERVTGEKQLSDQGIWLGVREKDGEFSLGIVSQVKITQRTEPRPEIDS